MIFYIHTNVCKNAFGVEKIYNLWYYIFDTTLMSGTKSGTEVSSFNTLY